MTSKTTITAHLAAARLSLESATNSVAFLTEAAAVLMSGENEVSESVLAGFRILSDITVEKLWSALDDLEGAAHA